MNTLSITQSAAYCNPTGKNKRAIYTLKAQGRRVVKASSKERVLRLRGKRVANKALFNNEMLVHDHTTEPVTGAKHTTMVKVGMLYRGAERTYMVPVIWKKDYRGNYRRQITKKAFLALPRELQDVAIAMGVSVSGSLITFSRCIAAWAGHRVKGMHVHHVNMDTTDDRLGNLWVMTPKKHAAVHADKEDLVWDADWFEYTSCYAGMLQLDIAMLLSEDDYAEDLEPDPSEEYWYHEHSDEAYALMGDRTPLSDEVISLITQLQQSVMGWGPRPVMFAV